MTASQLVEVLAKSEARRNRAIIDSIYTPALRDTIDRYQQSIIPSFAVEESTVKRLSEIVAKQMPRYEVPPSLVEQMAKQLAAQNRDLIRMAKKHAALFNNIQFELPQGYMDAVATWREQLEGEAVEADDPSVVAERLRRLADERQRIVDCLGQCSGILEVCRLMDLPIPTPILALFVVAYVLGWAANGFLDDRG